LPSTPRGYSPTTILSLATSDLRDKSTQELPHAQVHFALIPHFSLAQAPNISIGGPTHGLM
jgi:hypothetical protein